MLPAFDFLGAEYGAFQHSMFHVGSPNKKAYSILGSVLGTPYSWKLPYRIVKC